MIIRRQPKVINNPVDRYRGKMDRHPGVCLVIALFVGLAAVASCVASGLR